MTIRLLCCTIPEVVEPNDRDIQAHSVDNSDRDEDPRGEKDGIESHSDGDGDTNTMDNMAVELANLTGRKKKLFELRLKMNEARKANQTAMVTEKRKMETPAESRGMSKQKWATKASDDKVERMVKELKDREEKRKSFSRRRRYHEEKDIDSINDRNEHFNKKIERAFGKYTLEIKNNLERGTALPD
nr:pre-mRNA-splicing factor SYF2-like [Ipomoea batatas]